MTYQKSDNLGFVLCAMYLESCYQRVIAHPNNAMQYLTRWQFLKWAKEEGFKETIEPLGEPWFK